jgi:hypothetical protein
MTAIFLNNDFFVTTFWMTVFWGGELFGDEPLVGAGLFWLE